MLLSAVPMRLLTRRSRSLSPCRALHPGAGESSARGHCVRELEAVVSSNQANFGSRASRKCTLLGEREEACSSSANLHAQYRLLASRWRTSLESRMSSWAALVTAGHNGAYRGEGEGEREGQNTRGQYTGAGGWRGAASAGVLSTAALAFCFSRDNHNNPGKS